ncbi:unnamed protein product [Adineta steineri]|uniref:Cysteine dioxygenase n=1 Tax=Adineta steineri TaxID=433720 RepID=A0A815FRI0_9BILA|nr:unnamed protein product [Adineta steineri]CAF1395838.1 unnamed protein product [Adineta steineri]
MYLMFNGEQLDEEDIVSDFDIKAGSKLELVDPTVKYRKFTGFFGLKFVDVSNDKNLNRKEWSKTAPRWRRARHGLCLEGECKNSKCEASGRTVIMPIGYKKFDMSSDPSETTTKCPVCKKYVPPVTCGFNNCWWRYDGVKDCQNAPPESCSSGWKRADDAYYHFKDEQNEIIDWRKLIFEAIREHPSEAASEESVGLEASTGQPEESARFASRQPQTTSKLPQMSAAAIAAIPPKHSFQPKEAGVDGFAQPDKFWCPWKSNLCKNNLTIKGQGTVSIMQQTSIPFKLRLSNKEDPHDRDAYSIMLSINENKVVLSTSTGQTYESTDQLHILQRDDGNWHRYWISFFETDGNIKYGVGEIRPLFAVFSINVSENERKLMKEVYYLHIELNNNDRMLTELDEFKEKFRFYIGKDPVVYDPPLFVVPYNQYYTVHATEHIAIPPSKLEKTCRDLYDSVINFELNTKDFSDLTRVIDESIKNKKGWCHKKLTEKANHFGKPNFKASYLRITLGNREGSAPGHTYVVEVWPAGHFSPIHNHSNAYAIIRVLYGGILLKLYPALRLNVIQYKPIEQFCREGQVTWILPNLNQTHQLKHVDPNGTCCITIQCYAYGTEDQQHYEYFDYLTSDEQSIGHFDPKSDIDFKDFVEVMRQEKNNIFH